MLLKLSPSQVSNYWQILAEGVRASLFPTVKDTGRAVNGYLEALLGGRMDCWVYFEENQLVGMVITSLLNNSGGERYLSIEALYAYRMSGKRIWLDAVGKLQEHAHSGFVI
jgi:hypothetical protein